ncbi:hypothetical protein TNCV_4150111 [Trichonephila clavipes]|uniref:Uncharacterized protein n=1 Tax=Trichonephila clavipes TaxID=2585209 RepID=A0A8X6W5C9_TRICX|nr:hypothetical protein TNCV_4150111 [Trichonephila clavipes]
MKNLTSLTSSEFNELNRHAMLSEWTKTAPLKMSSMPNQLEHGEKTGQTLDEFIAWKKSLSMRTKNWRTLAGRKLAWKKARRPWPSLQKAKAYLGQSSH